MQDDEFIITMQHDAKTAKIYAAVGFPFYILATIGIVLGILYIRGSDIDWLTSIFFAGFFLTFFLFYLNMDLFAIFPLWRINRGNYAAAHRHFRNIGLGSLGLLFFSGIFMVMIVPTHLTLFHIISNFLGSLFFLLAHLRLNNIIRLAERVPSISTQALTSMGVTLHEDP